MPMSPTFKKPVSRVNKIPSLVLKTAILGALVGTFALQAKAQSIGTGEITLEQVQAISNTVSSPDKITAEQDLRSKALREAAQSYGARAGLLQTTNKIREVLEQHSTLWDAAFNFGNLLLVDEQPGEKNPEMRQRLIVPAVITRSTDNTSQESGSVFHITDDTYRINEQAHFTSVAPNWRTYLIRDSKEQSISPPHTSLLPKDDSEKEKYRQWISDGWNSGVTQAWAIYSSDLKRLERDIVGMHLYHELVEQKQVSLPFVATSNLAVSGDDNTMNINDVTLKITVMPAFQRDPQKWTPKER